MAVLPGGQMCWSVWLIFPRDSFCPPHWRAQVGHNLRFSRQRPHLDGGNSKHSTSYEYTKCLDCPLHFPAPQHAAPRPFHDLKSRRSSDMYGLFALNVYVGPRGLLVPNQPVAGRASGFLASRYYGDVARRMDKNEFATSSRPSRS